MAEPSEDPTSAELLERIIRLESENMRLRTRCNDFEEAFKSHIDCNAHDLRQDHDLLFAIANKVFPNLSEMQGKMNAVVPPCYAPPSVDTRPRDYKRRPRGKIS